MIPRDQVLEQAESLPTLSKAVAQLATAIRDERTDGAALEAIIRVDPALTANLLKVANSAFFGCARKVESLAQAIALLGRDRLFALAASAAFGRILPEKLPGYGIDALGFWTHCEAVGVMAERLALQIEGSDTHLCFTAGLLHDIGKLAISSFMAQSSTAVMDCIRIDNKSLLEAERAVLGLDHADIGAELARRWLLPETLAQVALHHHKPSAIAGSAASQLVDLVHLADCLAHSVGYGADLGEMSRRLDRDVPARLKLRVAQLEQVASETIEPIQDLGGLFQDLSGGR